MRITYIADHNCTGSGGAEAHIRGFVQELYRQGHSVHVFASGRRSPFGGSVKYHYVPQLRIPGLFALSFGILSLAPFTLHLIFDPPDIVYSRFFLFLPLHVVISRIFGIPFVVEFNSDLAAEREATKAGRTRVLVGEWLERIIYKSATGVIAVSAAILDSLHRRFGASSGATAVFSNGVDTEIYYPKDASKCREKLGLDTHGLYVMFVGSFQAWQGLETLVRSAVHLVQQVPNAVYVMVGDGPLRNRLEALVTELQLEDHFLFVGKKSLEEAADYINASNVCVAPYGSNAAGWDALGAGFSSPPYGAPLKRSPIKIYSYLACARPVVATHYQEAGCMVEKVGAGIAVPSDDSQKLATAIAQILLNPDQAQRMGQSGWLAVHQDHTWSIVTRRIVEYLGEIVAKTGRS